MANKITKVEMFNLIKAQVVGNEEMVAFIDHEIELLQKKASHKSSSKKQEANVGIKDTILAFVEEGGSYTITEMIKGCAELSEFSNQKVSVLANQLVEEGLLTKVTDKKVSRFSIATVEEE